jgi:hypothetical protein
MRNKKTEKWHLLHLGNKIKRILEEELQQGTNPKIQFKNNLSKKDSPP